MAAEMETESLTVNVWYHDVKLQSSAFRAPKGSDQGWVQLTEPMPVGTSLTLEVVSGDGAPSGARIPVQVLRLRENVGETPDPGNEVRLLTSLADATVAPVTAAPPPVPPPTRAPEPVAAASAPEPELEAAAPAPEPVAAAPAPEPELEAAAPAPEPVAAAPAPEPEPEVAAPAPEAPPAPQTEITREDDTGEVSTEGEGGEKKRRRRRRSTK